MDEYRDMIQEYWAAPEPPRFGMSVTDLADYQNQLCRYARRRIYGDGADQYDLGNQQKFESMSMDELWTGAREEIADLINYLTMLDIKLGRLIKGFNGANW
jgi:hypothetical protein